MLIEEPGIYDLPAEVYHADPCPLPSLSSSMAHILLTHSARHAWFAHPRLNPTFAPQEGVDRFDLGTAAHAYLLEGDASFVIVEAPDWRTKSAQVARAEAKLVGKVALLATQWAEIRAMAEAAGPQLDAHEDPPRPLANGQPEQTLVWQEGEIWCRARLDWLHDDGKMIEDYKTTSMSANPDAWTRGPLFNSGYDLQAAFYLRGLQVLRGVEATFRFVVQETFAPYALAVIGLGPDVLTVGEKKRRHAVELWDYCLKAGQWPGYPTRTCYAELPPWEEARWLERELRDERPRGVRDDGRSIEDLLA